MPQFHIVIQAEDRYGMVVHGLAGKRLIKHFAEWVFTENTNGEGRLGAGVCSFRPFNEFGKIEEKGGFYPIFVERIRLTLGTPRRN